ncbi:MAG: OmpA family protein [Gallionella sp.]|nr:OmpA family protein [Gallionella sp.]
MKLTLTSSKLSLAVLVAIASPLAMADEAGWTDDSGWFMGANIGQSRTTIDDPRITANLLAQGLTTTAIADNNRDTGYKLFGGYQFNKYFGLEGGYFNLGQFGFLSTTLPAGSLAGNIKLQGLSFGTVGTLPITERFSAFGRLGLNYAQSRTSFSGTGAGLGVVPLNPNPNKNQINYKLGLGVQYDVTPSLGMRAEVERYRVNDAIGNKGDVDLYTIGLIYRFGVEEPTPPVIIVQREEPPAPIVVEPEPVIETPKPIPVPVPVPRPVRKKTIFNADTSADSLFDFGKAVVKPGGRAALDQFSAELIGAQFEVITVTGHTDRIGSQAYNEKLSARRAEVVKDYLVVSAGIPANKISARGVAGAEPITKPDECKGKKATRALIACLAPDRRVEVDVDATRTEK